MIQATLINGLPAWLVFTVTGFLATYLGVLLARQIWGKNARRLERALSDSAYLAGQWATLGISQSQLVEKLGQRLSDESSDAQARENDLNAELRDREQTISQLEEELGEISSSRSALSRREVESLQREASGIEERDDKIRNLESKVKSMTLAMEEKVESHQKRVEEMTEQIRLLREPKAGANAEIKASNERLDGELKKRVGELARLKEQFDQKTKDVEQMRKQNHELKAAVDKLVAKWADQKQQDQDSEELRTKLAKANEELSVARQERNRLSLELEQALAADHDPDVEAEREELRNTNARMDMLLEELERRDKRVDNLERLLDQGGGSAEIKALTSMVENLQEQLAGVQQPREVAPVESGSGDVDINRLSQSNNQRSRVSSQSPGQKSVVYFDRGSDEIGEDGAKLLSRIARGVIDSGQQLSLSAYACADEDDAEGKAISSERVESVQQFLTELGVEPELLVTSSRGLDPALANSREDSWRARRVEIVLLPVAEVIN